MDQGYVFLLRKIMVTSFYATPFTCRLAIHCILKANHKDKKILFNNQEITVKRGTFITGLHVLKSETGLTIQNLRTSLETLENIGFISRKATNRFSIISVCKYNDYQSPNKQPNKQLTNKQQTSNKPVTISQQQPMNEKNEKNEKKEHFTFLNNLNFKELWEAWLEVRTKINAPNTERALNIHLKVLHKESIDVAIKMLEKAVGSGWKGIFPLRASFGSVAAPKNDLKNMTGCGAALKVRMQKEKDAKAKSTVNAGNRPAGDDSSSV